MLRITVIVFFVAMIVSSCADNFHTYDPAWDELSDTTSVFNTDPTKITIKNRILYLDSQRYIVRGFIYNPVPIGYAPGDMPYLEDKDILNRDFEKMRSIKTSSIRVPLKLTSNNLLDAAYNYHSQPIYVILDFPVDPRTNLGNPSVQENIRAELIEYVVRYKYHDGLLGFCIGNNVNRDYKGDRKDWYKLLALLSKTAKEVDDSGKGHIIMTANYGIDEIGKKEYSASDEELAYLDCWGINISDGRWPIGQASNAFGRSGKVICVTEYGIDSFKTTETGGETDEETQSRWIGQYANSLEAAEYVVAGGFINSYCDGWWHGGSMSEQDYKYGYTTITQPDNFANYEFFGICYIEKNNQNEDSYVDKVRPKKAWYALEAIWTGHGH